MSRPDIPQMPLRILEAVRRLHRVGYLGVRILPGINASGSAWRIIIFSVVEWDPEDEFGNHYLAEESSFTQPQMTTCSITRSSFLRMSPT